MGRKDTITTWVCDVCGAEGQSEDMAPPHQWSDQCAFYVDNVRMVKFTACPVCLGRKGKKLNVRDVWQTIMEKLFGSR